MSIPSHPPPQIKKIPLNLVTGLSRLRPQIRLLVIQRSGLQSLEEVLDKCGGDNSAPFSWASLKEVDFSHNAIRQLGPSLVRVQYISFS